MKTLYSYCKGYGVLFLLSIFGLQMNAQDIHFSQFGNSPMNLSPALTGMFGGDMRFVGNYRSQWSEVPVDYLTFSGAFDMKFDKFCSNHDQWAGGILFNYDVAGDSKLHLAQIGLNVSYTHRVNPKNFMTLGLQLSGYERGFSTQNLRWDNQFDGRIGNTTLPSGEVFENTSVYFGDFSAGFNWHFQNPNSQDGWDPQNRTKLDVGASVYHINRPDQSFYDGAINCDCYMRYNVYGLGTFRVSNPLDIVVVGMYQSQGPHSETVLGLGGKIHLDQRVARQLNILLGMNFRVGDMDAVIPNIEVQYNAWRVGFSYDVNVSEFDNATNNFGGPELSVGYIFVRPRLNSFKNCNPIY